MAGKAIKYESLQKSVGDLWPHVSALAIDRYPKDYDKALKWGRAQQKNLTGHWPKWGRGLEPVAVPDARVTDAVRAEWKRFVRQQYAIKNSQKKRAAKASASN